MTAVVGFALAGPASGQLVLQGTTDSYLYAFETVDSDQQLDFYQGLRLRAWVKEAPQVKLRTSFRVARRGDPSDWESRLYNAYFDWKPTGDVNVRAGRQFLWRGVIVGTADALSVKAKPHARIETQVVGGLEVPRGRNIDVGSTDAGYVLGAYGSGRLSGTAKVDVSYFQRVRSEALVWQLAGAALSGQAAPGLFYLAQFDYNLKSSDYQRLRLRAMYTFDRWTLSGEFQSQKPEVFEDSFFNVFSLSAYNQVRAGGYYRIGQYQLGLQNYLTLYDEGEAGNEVLASVSARWGTVGVVYRTGFGGDRIGLYGAAQYEIANGVQARASSSYYNFQRYTADFDEDATSFSAGLRITPVRNLMFDAEVQESLNSLYDNDLRGLFRIVYNFSTI